MSDRLLFKQQKLNCSNQRKGDRRNEKSSGCPKLKKIFSIVLIWTHLFRVNYIINSLFCPFLLYNFLLLLLTYYLIDKFRKRRVKSEEVIVKK